MPANVRHAKRLPDHLTRPNRPVPVFIGTNLRVMVVPSECRAPREEGITVASGSRDAHLRGHRDRSSQEHAPYQRWHWRPNGLTTTDCGQNSVRTVVSGPIRGSQRCRKPGGELQRCRNVGELTQLVLSELTPAL